MRGLLQIGIRAGMDPLEGCEEKIVKVVLYALTEGQGLAQTGILSLSRETPPYSPPPPRKILQLHHLSQGRWSRVQHLLQGDLLMEKLIF